MDFKRLTEGEQQAVAELATLQTTLARAELLDHLAGIRLAFAEQAERELACDPWLLDQADSVRTVVFGAVAQTRAEELARRAEAQAWLADAPRRIAALRARLSAAVEATDG